MLRKNSCWLHWDRGGQSCQDRESQEAGETGARLLTSQLRPAGRPDLKFHDVLDVITWEMVQVMCAPAGLYVGGLE